MALSSMDVRPPVALEVTLPPTWATTELPFSTTAFMEDVMNETFGAGGPCQSDGRLIDFSEFDYPYRKDTWIPITWREVLKIVAYMIVFLVSVAGNLLVILVVYYNAHMRNSTNTYLVNLAVADLLVTFGCMWVHIIRHLSHPNYVLPAIMCKVDSFMQATALLASVLTLTVISVGRFVAVMFPLQAHTSPDRAHRVIAAVWLTSILLACPLAIYRELHSFKNDNELPSGLRGSLPKPFSSYKYHITPIALASNDLQGRMVGGRLWMTQLPGEHSAPARNTATRAKKRVVKMVSVVLLVFVICWTPLQSLILYSNFIHAQHYAGELPQWFPVMEFCAYFVAYSNSALNPIIYCGFNASFRQGLVSLVTCRHSSSSIISYGPSTGRWTISQDRTESSEGHWKGMTAGTRETTVACSGPEPAVLLEFSSLRRSRMHKAAQSAQESDRLVVATSNKNPRGTVTSDLTCKKCYMGVNLQQTDSQLTLNHHGTTTTTSFILDNHHESPKSSHAGHSCRRLDIQVSNSSSNSGTATVTTVCGCCKRKFVDDDMYDLKVVKTSADMDTKGDML
ncbi:QRFP-like peptide receptor [Penaeus chinensis]|uniref:QRFP-like peptide receptor n=1 Tax=Penaeus chinensis TaxID=139456 RepID=UPI001FB7A18E|nr:QRFP-like peptide receptor [Penaeus chinensis]